MGKQGSRDIGQFWEVGVLRDIRMDGVRRVTEWEWVKRGRRVARGSMGISGAWVDKEFG